jgi:hypothetical protein
MSESPVSRRDLGGVAAGAGLTAAASSGIVEAPAQTAPKTFVLVHGAWHGGWCWRRVSDLLEKKGHKVVRAHTHWARRTLAPPDKGRQSGHPHHRHRQCREMGRPQGHLPGRSLLWRLARFGCPREEIGNRVSSIVWLDAFKPENGQRGADYTSEAFRKALFAAAEKGEPGRPTPKVEAFGVNQKDRAWVESKLSPRPTGAALQPIKLTGARDKVAKKIYIRVARYPQSTFDKALAECKGDPSWRTFETTDAGHDVMVDALEWLVGILLEVS